MKSMSHGRMVAAALLLGAVAATGVRAQSDRIHLANGTTIPPDGARFTINVTGEDFKAVKYRQSNARAVEQRVKSSDVMKISRAAVPKVWEQALSARIEGDYVTAADSFRQAAGRSSPYWIKAQGLFEAGETLMQARDWNGAIQAYQDLISQVSNSRFLPQSSLRIAEAYFNANDRERARATLKNMLSEASSKGYASRFVTMAEFWQIRCREGSDWDQTIRDFQNLHDKVRDSAPRVANMCALRIGHGLIQQRKFGDAREFFQSIADRASDDEVEALVGAWLGLGNCYSAESRNEDKKLLGDARRCYLRVVVSYYDDPATSGLVPPSMAAEALYKAGLCFEILREENYRRRARGLYTEVVRDFEDSQWADQARKRL